MKFSQLVCPISDKRIDCNVSRMMVFLSSIVIAAYLYTRVPYFMIAVAFDYGIRAFGNPKYSLLRLMACGIVKALRLPELKIDLAPKLFASRLGFLCAIVSAGLFFLNAQAVSIGIAILFLGLTLLDSVFDFCVGCLIYHYLVFPIHHRKFHHSNI
jgi:hypothetical protein